MIKSIRPVVFEPFPQIQAFFTLSNRQLTKKNNHIEGLNFGTNTSDTLSVIEQNRKTLADEFKFSSEAFAIAGQVHSDTVEFVSKPGLYNSTDGLITKTEGLVLAIQVADCAAVFVADTENDIIGIFHAGWRGAASNIVLKGIDKMASLAEKKAVYVAYISPCISEKNFEVGPEVSNLFPDSFVDDENYNKPHINLKAFLKAELMRSGVEEKCIEVSHKCTFEDPQFYSYRREREKAGRMLACMYMNKRKVKL